MSNKTIVILISAVFVVLFGLIVGTCYAVPKYRVWEQGQKGKAEMARAEQNRRVKVLEATAKRDSAKMEAEAEVERARGVAQANAIIADGLQGHEEYLRYLWIDKVAGTANREVIYIPTEANMPILESTRLKVETK